MTDKIVFKRFKLPSKTGSEKVNIATIPFEHILTEGLAESVVGAEGAPRAFILKLGYFGSIL